MEAAYWTQLACVVVDVGVVVQPDKPRDRQSKLVLRPALQ